MNSCEPSLEQTVDSVVEALPLVWDLIRANLRAAATGKFGITLEQFHVLRHIRKGYNSVSDLAEKKQISRAAVSQAVEMLVSKGLVTRHQESEDRRCVRLELTPYAIEVLDANFDENRAWMKERMTSLTAEERALIQEAMKTLRKTFIPEESLEKKR
jgi:DNA-binding MarR family transcriptional regulator